MTNNFTRNPDNSEDQTRTSGGWDNQYIAPPDANMAATPDQRGQGHSSNTSNPSHEYGGSPADTRVSDSRSHDSHRSDYGSEAGTMGSAYDTERAQIGTPSNDVSSPARADLTGLHRSDDDATYSGGRHDNPYDTGSPATAENEDPANLASLSGHSDQREPSEMGEALAGLNDAAARDKGLEGRSHLYTPGETEENYPATLAGL